MTFQGFVAVQHVETAARGIDEAPEHADENEGSIMRQRDKLVVMAVLAATARAASGQSQATDLSARIREVLPPRIAEHVLATIAAARSQDLPAAALENRTLKFAARGIPPKDIERAIDEQADRMAKVRGVLAQARARRPSAEEVDAAAEAMRRGVDRARIGDLAKSAPSGRSLAVPLYVMGSLIDRGLPSAEAAKRVRDRLQARASDADLEQMAGDSPSQGPPGQAKKPGETGRELADAKRGNGSSGGGPPSGVPANGGHGAKPKPHKPPTPPGKKP